MSGAIDHQTDFHAPVDGPVHAGSGDIIIYDIGEAYDRLKAMLPAGDVALSSLVQSLRGFAAYHEVIGEWKELHNLLQELLNELSQFVNEVDWLCSVDEAGDREQLRRRWRPCERRIRRLIGFAKGVSYIGQVQFRDQSGDLSGPPWAIEIVLGQRKIRELLNEKQVQVEILSEWANELYNTCDSHLYQADKNLHDKAGELCDLSKKILARIEQ